MKPRVFLPAIASGALLWTAFFPFDLGPVAFIALVPWLTLVRSPVSNKRRYFAAYVGGFTFFALATNWVRVAHPMMYLSWLGLTLVMPLFWLAALAFIRRLDRLGLPLALAVPVGWVALEYFRMHFPTGFPFMKLVGAYQMIGFGWYFLGYTQHAFTPLIQTADVGGVYAVSFVVASANGALVDVAMRLGVVRRMMRWEPTLLSPSREGENEIADASRQDESQPIREAAFSPSLEGDRRVGSCARMSLLISLTLLAISLGYGFYRLQHEPFADGPLVAAVQGSFGQGEKMGEPNRLLRSYYDLHAKAFETKPTPELIVWPETCCPIDWFEITTGARGETMPRGFRQGWSIADDELLGRDWGVPALFGLNGHEWDGENQWKYNSALLLNPLPRDPLATRNDPIIHRSVAAGRYDKMHLVPFGEYVPLGKELPFMKWFTPYKHEYSCRPGERWTRFPLNTKDGRAFTFACLICYEDSDTYLARQYVASEPVNFFVNISNDGWFDGTEEHEQHLAICRFRAIEARRAIVRAVNMGISAVVDSDGRVVALPRTIVREPNDATKKDKITLNEQPQSGWSESKKVEGVVIAAVPIDARYPLYATLGDWIPAACWLTVFVGVVTGRLRRTPPARAAGV